MDMQGTAIAMLKAQQAKVQPRSPQWMVAEQLMDICRRETRSAELIAQDLEHKDMDITAAEKKIKAFADGHKTGNFACVTPAEADRILRDFYGLPDLPDPKPAEMPAPAKVPAKKLVDLADFL